MFVFTEVINIFSPYPSDMNNIPSFIAHYTIFTTHAILYVVVFVLRAVVAATCILQDSRLT